MPLFGSSRKIAGFLLALTRLLHYLVQSTKKKSIAICDDGSFRYYVISFPPKTKRSMKRAKTSITRFRTWHCHSSVPSKFVWNVATCEHVTSFAVGATQDKWVMNCNKSSNICFIWLISQLSRCCLRTRQFLGLNLWSHGSLNKRADYAVIKHLSSWIIVISTSLS